MPLQDVVLRLLLAVLIGGVVGYEREYSNRPAGFRTHILVCTGAAIISLIQAQIVQEAIGLIENDPALANVLKADYGRMGAQVISGIGFLGAGTILHDKGSVKGLTTAASLWNIACLGLAVGMGYYAIALFGAVTCFVVLFVLRNFHDKLFPSPGAIKVMVKYKRRKKDAENLEQFFSMKHIRIVNIEYHGVATVDNEEDILTCQYTLVLPNSIDTNKLLSQLAIESGVISANLMQE